MTIIPDRFGYCVKCHKYLMKQEVIDMKVQMRFTADHTETEVMLNDGSKMRVCLCQSCKDNLVDKDLPIIMESVIEGWQEDLKQLDWPQEKKDKYIERYSEKKILLRTEGLDKNIIEKKVQDIKIKEGKVKYGNNS